MLAKIEQGNNILSFKHLGGLMRFVVKNVPAAEGSFTFTANVGITGDFQVETVESANVIKSTTVSDNNNSVSISYEAGEAGRTMTFYVPLPVGTYTGFTIALGEKSYETTTAVNTINRGTLLLMPTYAYDETQGLVKGEVSSNNTINLEDGHAEATILGDAEVNVTTGNNNADAVATLNYTPATDGNSNLSISDGSADGTESGDSQGKVVVATATSGEDVTVASCDINAPTLSVTLSATGSGSVTYEQVTANTAKQTLVIGKGITVETLIINGGNVIIEEGAKVTTIQNAENFSDKTYVVKKGELTNEPTGANIILVSNESEMALRVAAENGGTVVLEEDVTLTETLIIAADKDVALDLNGKTISQEKACTAHYEMIKN